MFSAQDLSVKVNRSLDEISFPGDPVHLYAPMRYVLSMGGKRLRPVLTLMSANLFSDNIDTVIPVALAIEVFHNFTLVHDDIMDDAPLRRKNPTVHKRWDNNVALLSGDALSILAYRLFQDAPEHLLPRLYREFNQTAIHVCEGQQLDMDFETLPEIGMTDYLRMISLKTAALISGAMKLGAMAIEAPEKDISLLRDAGNSLGLAFQIQDDYLDLFGETEQFGKTKGGDILNNKKTFLLVDAFEKATGDTKMILKELFSHNYTGHPEEKIRQVAGIYHELQVPETARWTIRDHTEKAINAIHRTSVENSRKKVLVSLIRKMLERES